MASAEMIVRGMAGEVLQASASGRAVSDLDARIDQVQGMLDTSREITGALREVFLSACELYRAGKELDAIVARCEIEARSSVARVRAIAPLVQQQIGRLSDQIDRALDRASAIDPIRCPPSELTYRTELMRLAEQKSERIHSVLMRLMSI
jgi:hypothetical protein